MTLLDLKTLVQKPAWSKEVVLWVGSDDILDECLFGYPQAKFDILDLFSEPETFPVAEDERRAIIKRSLNQRLKELRPSGDNRLILRVYNIGLIGRYRVGLGPFYDWFSGSRTMVVLCLKMLKPVSFPMHLEKDLEYHVDGLIDYFKTCLADPNKIYMER